MSLRVLLGVVACDTSPIRGIWPDQIRLYFNPYLSLGCGFIILLKHCLPSSATQSAFHNYVHFGKADPVKEWAKTERGTRWHAGEVMMVSTNVAGTIFIDAKQTQMKA